VDSHLLLGEAPILLWLEFLLLHEAHHLYVIMRRVHDAAEGGASEIMIGKFPCALCTDGGRKINAPEESWPDTLQGIAREFFEFWERNLKPRGFRLRVQILDFPGGKPGDVGAFLSWKA